MSRDKFTHIYIYIGSSVARPYRGYITRAGEYASTRDYRISTTAQRIDILYTRTQISPVERKKSLGIHTTNSRRFLLPTSLFLFYRDIVTRLRSRETEVHNPCKNIRAATLAI